MLHEKFPPRVYLRSRSSVKRLLRTSYIPYVNTVPGMPYITELAGAGASLSGHGSVSHRDSAGRLSGEGRGARRPAGQLLSNCT